MDNGHNYNNSMDVQIEVIGRKPDVKNVHINGSAFIGRANTCDVFINEVTVSSILYWNVKMESYSFSR